MRTKILLLRHGIINHRVGPHTGKSAHFVSDIRFVTHYCITPTQVCACLESTDMAMHNIINMHR